MSGPNSKYPLHIPLAELPARGGKMDDVPITDHRLPTHPVGYPFGFLEEHHWNVSTVALFETIMRYR